MDVSEFDSLPREEAQSVVAVWAAIPEWVDAVLDGRPYGSVAALEQAAADAAASWSRGDLDAALAHHPRIGERPSGTGAEAAASRREQAAMSDAAADVTARIAAGNAAYEERFGRVFLIRAAGRSPEEILVELDRRLLLDADAEAAEAAEQLRQIALLRLRTTITDSEGESA